MKTPLSFYLLAAVAGTVACSDGAATRDRNTTAGSGGQTSVVTGGGAGGSSGSSQGSSGAGGGTTGGSNMGPALVITPSEAGDTATVVDSAGTTGLNGLAQVIKSPMGTTVTAGFKEGGLCMKGTTVVVPNGDYTNYWGAEIDLDVKLTDAPGGGGGGEQMVVDAGADACDAGPAVEAPAQVPVGWNASASNVVGFSFKLDGPTVPIAFRFKALPFGANSSTTTYCNQVAAVSGATVNVRFDQITFECWNMGGVGALTMPYPPDNPDGKLLRTISWQVPADIAVPFPFDFCVSDIKPILAN